MGKTSEPTNFHGKISQVKKKALMNRTPPENSRMTSWKNKRFFEDVSPHETWVTFHLVMLVLGGSIFFLQPWNKMWGSWAPCDQLWFPHPRT